MVSFPVFMLYAALIVIAVIGVVFIGCWIGDNIEELKTKFQMWRILRLKGKVVFFLNQSGSNSKVEVWYKTSKLLEYTNRDGESVYPGSPLGLIHKLYKDSIK